MRLEILYTLELTVHMSIDLDTITVIVEQRFQEVAVKRTHVRACTLSQVTGGLT